jgi:outer membrane protein OmpA-like peptidoglycan-associated protein
MLGACSGASDWTNPVTAWFDTFGDEEDKIADSSRSTAYKPYPKLSETPDRPKGTAPEESQKVASGLVADRENAKYTDQQLRASGTQLAERTPPPASAPAATPTPPPPPTTAAKPEPAPVEVKTTPAMQAPKPPAPQPATTGTNVRAIDEGRPISVPSIVQRRARAQPTPTAIEEAAGQRPATASQMPAIRRSAAPAAAPMAPGASPVAAAPAPTVRANLPVGADQAALSEAFNAGLSQQAAMAPSGVGAQGFQASGAKPIDRFGAPVPSVVQQNYNSSIAGRPSMLEGTAAPAAPQFANLTGNMVVVHFGHSSAALTDKARASISRMAKAAVDSGRGLRVVGHASQRTMDMKYERHKRANFSISLDRAGAVADALRQNGVPAERILIEARGSDEPVYHEFMPKGEAYNRRVEIYLQ